MSKKQLALVCLIFVFLLGIQSSPIINEIGAQIQEDSELIYEDTASPLSLLNFNFLNSSDQVKNDIDYISSNAFPVNSYNNRTDFVIGEKELSWQKEDSDRNINLADEATEKFDRQLEERLEEITGVGFIQAVNKDYSNYNLLSDIKTHVVKPGESLWTIASKHNINIDTLIGANDINDMNQIMPGDELTILPVRGIMYRIGPGDSFKDLVSKYNLDKEEVKQANNIRNPENISQGKNIILPGAEPEFGYQDRLNQMFVRPVEGRISSPFGPRWGSHHDGKDYAVPIGTPVKAAGGGRVVYVGWSSGYGNTVILQHQEGMRTLYAHLNSFNVSSGQRVNRGQVIARSGNTGRSTGPHLHFEVRVNGRPVDPAGYLR
ncbi:M23 family metallopeptidase [Halanaerobiaceae bacterium Z-7014]|uniref:M23 family metallopeptidase n=1 Tax=Halonatronomonas betaini TaxID=2778430 RepID=A0A931ASP3_9FIRM|nr:M23 family metallopeptidase [Halonatronomonas betaini]MBF8435909.1 M23 family metallopeptidase [Halonatronomonas betaini]